MSENEQRRKFLSGMVWGIQALIGAILTVLLTSASMLPVFRRRRSDWLPLVDLQELADLPRPLPLQFEQSQGWLTEVIRETVYARVVDGHPLVLSSRCTHLGCAVQWESGSAQFRCPCHGGVYRADGSVAAGPPPRPLARLETELRDGTVWVRRA